MRIGPLGIWELLIILVVVLLIFGPRRLPEMAKGLGQSVREFRKGIRDIKNDFEEGEKGDASSSTASSAPASSAPASSSTASTASAPQERSHGSTAAPATDAQHDDATDTEDDSEATSKKVASDA